MERLESRGCQSPWQTGFSSEAKVKALELHEFRTHRRSLLPGCRQDFADIAVETGSPCAH